MRRHGAGERLEPEFGHAGFFHLRSPLLPADETFRFLDTLETPRHMAADDATLQAAMERDRELTGDFIERALADPRFAEAIFIASPDLVAAIADLPGCHDPRDRLRVEIALLKYIWRASYRCTPFGLFAATSFGNIGGATRLQLGDGLRKHVRLDSAVMQSMVESLRSRAEPGRDLLYYRNSSLYGVGDRYHYAEATATSAGRTYSLTAIDARPELDACLVRAAAGASIHDLMEVLADHGAAQEESSSFIEELIDAQVLVSGLAAPLTGEDPLASVRRQLNGWSEFDDRQQQLVTLEGLIAALNDSPIGSSTRDYSRVAEVVEAGIGRPAPKDCLQIDMSRTTTVAQMSESLAEELLDCVNFLQRLGDAADPLLDFAAKFTERFEAQSIPLAEALDDEVGIGLPSPPTTPSLTPDVERQLGGLYHDAIAGGHTEIVVDGLHGADPRLPLPESFAVMATILSSSDTAFERNDYRILFHLAMGPSALSLVGRFCHLDAELAAASRSFAGREQALHPDGIIAEIVHQPDGRGGNVSWRPVMRGFEIEYLGTSGAPPDQRLGIDDLLVTVAEGHVRLWSRAHGREVIPRLASAHNYSGDFNLPIYRFLGMLQRHGCHSAITWSWGHLSTLPFLPRVRYKRCIVARARWTVSDRELTAAVSAAGVQRLRLTDAWRKQRRMPRLVSLVAGDNRLLIDLGTEHGVEMYLREMTRLKTATVTEVLPAADELFASTGGSRFTHELVVPFVRTGDRLEPRPPLPTAAAHKRRFPPGGEWLYAKLYCGSNLMDRVLRDAIPTLLAECRRVAPGTKFFFVRYKDPEAHVRVRFYDPEGLLGKHFLELLHSVTEPLIEHRLVWKAQLDTYQRETERYGGPEAIELVEELFCADSDATIKLLQSPMMQGDGRLVLAIRQVSRLLDDFSWLSDERMRWLEEPASAFPKAQRQQWSLMHRTLKSKFPEFFSPAPTLISDIEEILDRRSATSARVARALAEMEKEGRLRTPLGTVLRSISHMGLNRLLKLDLLVAQEPMVYDLCRRASLATRARNHDDSRSATR